MNIQDLGAIGELTSAIVISITLVFLVIENRRSKIALLQNNRVVRQQMRSLIHQSLANDSDLADSMYQANEYLSPQFAKQYQEVAGEFGLEPAQYIRLVNYLRIEFSYYEDQFFAELPREDRRAVDAHFMGSMRNPVTRMFWAKQQIFFHPKFVAHGDKLLESLVSNHSEALGLADSDA